MEVLLLTSSTSGQTIDLHAFHARMVEAAATFEELYTAMEGWSETVVEENPTLICQQGCARCCMTQVIVGEAEWVPIHAWMRANLTKSQWRRVVQRVHCQLRTPGNPLKRLMGMRGKHPRELIGSLGNAFGNEETRCPFLGDDNRCEIYPVRPFVCRAYGRAETSRGAPMLCNVFVGRYRQNPEAETGRTMESMARMAPKYFELNSTSDGRDGFFTIAAAHVLRNSTTKGDLAKTPVPLPTEKVFPLIRSEHFPDLAPPGPARMKVLSADGDHVRSLHEDT